MVVYTVDPAYDVLKPTWWLCAASGRWDGVVLDLAGGKS